MLRIMWWRKALAGEVEAQSVAARRAATQRVSVFTGDFAWHSAARNAEKSCVPTSSASPPRIAATSSGRWYQPTRAGEERRPHRPVDQQIGVVPRDGAEARVEVGGDRRRPQHGDRPRGRCALTPRTHARQRPRRRRVEVHDLRRRVHAGVGAPGRDAADRVRRRSRPARARARPARRARRAATASRWNGAPSYSSPRAMRIG